MTTRTMLIETADEKKRKTISVSFKKEEDVQVSIDVYGLTIAASLTSNVSVREYHFCLR